MGRSRYRNRDAKPLTEPVGKVRVLPFDAPHLPRSVPWLPDEGYFEIEEPCSGGLSETELPPEIGGSGGVYCTRPPHEDPLHVCHLRWHSGDPRVAITWGGE